MSGEFFKSLTELSYQFFPQPDQVSILCSQCACMKLRHSFWPRKEFYMGCGTSKGTEMGLNGSLSGEFQSGRENTKKGSVWGVVPSCNVELSPKEQMF